MIEKEGLGWLQYENRECGQHLGGQLVLTSPTEADMSVW